MRIKQCVHGYNINKGLFFSLKYFRERQVKFMFSKKATKIDEIFTIDLTLCSNLTIDGEDFVNFCGLLREHEL